MTDQEITRMLNMAEALRQRGKVLSTQEKGGPMERTDFGQRSSVVGSEVPADMKSQLDAIGIEQRVKERLRKRALELDQ